MEKYIFWGLGIAAAIWAVFMIKATWDVINLPVYSSYTPPKRNCLGMTETETIMISAAIICTI